MLVLSRLIGEKIVCRTGEQPNQVITFEVVDIRAGDRVRIGITADHSVRINRAEIDELIQHEQSSKDSAS